MTPKDLKEWRESRGWTQAECAKMFGYKSKTTIYNMEKGITPIPLLAKKFINLINATTNIK